ncbi:DUF1294 domain-containing protein [Neptuniibacter sp. PT8_73]|uniref:DUF1294 domain-containing protein n=1 Tax=Neptuniibacter sp. PT8_73 TaxID=3398206 RepID=UPI0039F62373
MRFQGKLTNWNDDRGFGFVEPNGGGDHSFVHIKSFQKPSRRPADGDLIIYEQVKDTTGKYKAVNISLVSDKRANRKASPPSRKIGAALAISFCAAVVITVFLKFLPFEILYLYAAASVVTFITYAFDKSAAKNNRWRTSESQLHLLSLVGGWPGAFLAQSKLRHKSRKKEFKQVYWITVVINIGAFGWLLSAHGQQFLETNIGL